MVRIPIAEFVRKLLGAVEEIQPAPRPRSLTPDRLREVAVVYRSNPKRPAAAVAKHLGGTGHAGRARASRAIDAARKQGYLGKAPGARRKGEEL